jgi:hypothetical protein
MLILTSPEAVAAATLQRAGLRRKDTPTTITMEQYRGRVPAESTNQIRFHTKHYRLCDLLKFDEMAYSFFASMLCGRKIADAVEMTKEYIGEIKRHYVKNRQGTKRIHSLTFTPTETESPASIMIHAKFLQRIDMQNIGKRIQVNTVFFVIGYCATFKGEMNRVIWKRLETLSAGLTNKAVKAAAETNKAMGVSMAVLQTTMQRQSQEANKQRKLTPKARLSKGRCLP